MIFTTSPPPSYSTHGENVSTRSYAGPDTLTSSSPPKLSCGFGFWRDFCCFLSLRATAAGESPFSCAASSSGVAPTESPTGRALDDCDGLVCLRLKTTGASSVMTFREVDPRRGSESDLRLLVHCHHHLPPAFARSVDHPSSSLQPLPAPMSRIQEVWGPNLEAEMRVIRDLIEKYPYVAMVYFTTPMRTLTSVSCVTETLPLAYNRIRNFRASSLDQSARSKPRQTIITRQ